MASMGGPALGGRGFFTAFFMEFIMTFKYSLLAAVSLAVLAFSSVAMAADGHDMKGMEMPGMTMSANMDKMHEELEAKLADTSAFGEKGDPVAAAETVKVVGEEIRYDVTSLTLKTGDTITFQFTNKGEQPHEFTIGDAAYQEAAKQMMTMMTEMGMDMTTPEHEAMHAKAGNTVIVKPGETKKVTWRFTKPGEFLFACNFVGHSEAGMLGSILVK
jgi:uncharacterized cupredoxin-like copper-binding protein